MLLPDRTHLQLGAIIRQHRKQNGWSLDHLEGLCGVSSSPQSMGELPTPRTTLRARYVRVLVWCKSCRHRRDADLEGPDRAGRGDAPLIHLRFCCSNCGSQFTEFVVTAIG